MKTDMEKYLAMPLAEFSMALVEKEAELVAAKESLAAGDLVNNQKVKQLRRELARMKTAKKLIIKRGEEE